MTEEDIDSLLSESEFKHQIENISEIRCNINFIWITSSIVLIFLAIFALYELYNIVSERESRSMYENSIYQS